MEYVIELINVGRGKVNKVIETRISDLTVAEHEAFKQVKKHLMSKNVWIEQKGGRFPPEEYEVFAGGRNVGEVKIQLKQSALN